jgi:WD40 repeat protein
MYMKLFLLCVLFIMVTLLLSACGTLNVTVQHTPLSDTPTLVSNPGLPTLTPMAPAATATDQPLNMDSSSDAIRQKMLLSALNWKTIWLDGTIYESMDSNGKPQDGQHQQIWIDQNTARFRFLSGPLDGIATRFKVSDGVSKLEMDLITGATKMSEMPQGIAGQFVSQPAAGIGSPNPLWQEIGEPLAEMALSSDYAQNDGTFKPVAIEMVAGRPALVMDWTYVSNSLPSWRLWLDVRTAVILKMQDFGKGGGNTAQDEYDVSQVQYDIPNLPEQLFSVTPATLPTFSDVTGAPLAVASPGPTVQAGSDPLGEVYLFLQTPGQDASGARLVRLPGSCVAGLQACTPLEQVPLPGITYANNGQTLAWSPDHKMVAFVANPADDGSTRLFVSPMPVPAWKQVAELTYLDLPAWSGDGQWISLRALDRQGNETYYVVHPDGSGLKNVSANDKLPPAGQPYNVDGWIANYLIVHSGRPGQVAKVYLLRAQDGMVRPMFDLAPTKVSYTPSPDGSLLAFGYYNESTQTDSLRILAPDGSGLRDLASFKGSISSITWSPDGSSLAFVVFGNGDPPKSDVYMINRDGRGLTQVYGEAVMSSLVYSPNGKFLLIESMEQNRLLVVDLGSLAAHLIQAPGLILTDFWREPSWVP